MPALIKNFRIDMVVHCQDPGRCCAAPSGLSVVQSNGRDFILITNNSDARMKSGPLDCQTDGPDVHSTMLHHPPVCQGWLVF